MACSLCAAVSPTYRHPLHVILLRDAASRQKAVLTVLVNRLAEGLVIASLSKRSHSRQKMVFNIY